MGAVLASSQDDTIDCILIHFKQTGGSSYANSLCGMMDDLTNHLG